ncbi:MAG TPA: DUF4386 family protein [Ktedonobacterales bacterium]|jgi:hypothetical protein|nr:DUF4386 family protein [Ktedonobacterales bacterium]
MTTILQQPSAARDAHADAARVEADWKPMYRMGGMAALISIAAIVIAVPIYLISPPPTTVLDWFTLFHQNAFVGLLDLDLLMLIGIAMSGLIYIALFGALRRANRPLIALGTIIGLVGVAVYFASNTAFNMLALSGQYDAATTDAERSQLLAAGQATLAIWQGSSYDIGYVLGGVAMLIIAVVMLRSAVFGRATGYIGLLTGALMLIPATAGSVGLVLSLVSLAPALVWDILIARRLFQLAASRAKATSVEAQAAR